MLTHKERIPLPTTVRTIEDLRRFRQKLIDDGVPLGVRVVVIVHRWPLAFEDQDMRELHRLTMGTCGDTHCRTRVLGMCLHSRGCTCGQ